MHEFQKNEGTEAECKGLAVRCFGIKTGTIADIIYFYTVMWHNQNYLNSVTGLKLKIEN